MRGRFLPWLFSLIYAAISLISCSPQGEDYQAGGGIGGTGNPTTPTETPVISSGAITGFGSVVVTEARYQIVNTPISVDGIPGLTQGDLKQGMIALVDGTITEQSRLANGIVVEDTVEGLVQIESAANPFLTILGMAIDTSSIADNKFKGVDGSPIGRTAFFNSLSPGVLVEVKGDLNAGLVDWEEAE